VVGDCLTHEASGWRIEIVDADTKRVSRVRLHPPEAHEEETTD
jgi:CBS domain containing-hemolysin-like protein